MCKEIYSLAGGHWESQIIPRFTWSPLWVIGFTIYQTLQNYNKVGTTGIVYANYALEFDANVNVGEGVGLRNSLRNRQSDIEGAEMSLATWSMSSR